MKKEYKKPMAEKVDFDYTESVEACPSGCVDPGHTWHSGYAYPTCNGGGNGGNGGNGGGGENGGNSYWGVAWGQQCS